MVKRHDAVVRALATIIYQATRAETKIEARTSNLDRQQQGRTQEGQMDIIVMNLDGTVHYIDVAIVSPVIANANHLAAASLRDGYAAKRMEAHKYNRYPVRNLVPFVLELGGRPGPAARKFVSSLFAESDTTKARGIAQVWATLSSVLQSAVAGQYK